jgi:hypothetical protein
VLGKSGKNVSQKWSSDGKMWIHAKDVFKIALFWGWTKPNLHY